MKMDTLDILEINKGRCKMDFKTFDPELWQAIAREEQRQQANIELIASENIVSKAVLAAQGSVLTNKYAEGYPNRRYYGGCQYVDEVETLAIERAKALFGAKFANVQPHSGSQANAAAYVSLVEPGATILGMDLAAGGHLTHGSPVNFSGKTYNFVGYQVSQKDECLDYAEIEALAQKYQPALIVAGASAYARTIDFAKFREIADKVGAKLMVDMAHIAGLVAAKLHPNPVPYADVVTTTTHKTLRGPRGGMILTNDEALAKKIDSAIFPGLQGGPLEHVIAGKAAAFKEALAPEFKVYCQNVLDNVQAMAEVFSKDDTLRLVSGGSDNHLLLLDVSKTGLNGKEVEKLLDEINITVNKNAIPFEKLSPFKTSGIRLGTAAITTRGFERADCQKVAEIIVSVLHAPQDENVLATAKAAVKALTDKHPL